MKIKSTTSCPLWLVKINKSSSVYPQTVNSEWFSVKLILNKINKKNRIWLLPMVVMTVAANMTAFGQFQLLKVLSPVMVTPCPAASDTTYIKTHRKAAILKWLHTISRSAVLTCVWDQNLSHILPVIEIISLYLMMMILQSNRPPSDMTRVSLTWRDFGNDSELLARNVITEMQQTKL